MKPRVAQDALVLEIADRLLPLLDAGSPVAVATCVDVVGGSPTGPGTSLALGPDGVPVGSVSGGCVESAALAACRDALAGEPAAVRRHGFGDGASCGGEVDVLTTVLTGPDAERVAHQLRHRLAGRAAAVALVIGGPRPLGSVLAAAPGAGPGSILLPDGTRVFVDAAPAAPRLLLLGATETAAALCGLAAAAGWRVTVGDVRAAFAVPQRFPAAAAVTAERPHDAVRDLAPTADDAVCLLGHDDDLDGLALAAALESPAGYVGALGSRGRTADRIDRLRGLGVSAADLARLRAPIGLDLGARSAAEVAVSILAELLAARHGASGAPLGLGSGPIHRAGAR